MTQNRSDSAMIEDLDEGTVSLDCYGRRLKIRDDVIDNIYPRVAKLRAYKKFRGGCRHQRLRHGRR